MFEQDYAVERLCPWSRLEIDREVDHRDPQTEGESWIRHRDGWTLLQWWDRTGDPRGGSSAGLLVEMKIDADNLLALGGLAFPGIFKRFHYGIKTP
jgi:hypothetical protein